MFPKELYGNELPEGLIHYYPVLDSTGIKLRELVQGGAVEGTAVVAEEQKAGRGRLGRYWYSPAGGFYLSVLFKPGARVTGGFSLVAAGSVIKSLRDCGRGDLSVKWPNDLFFAGKKVGGILCENFAGNMVVGIGLNIFSQPIKWPSDIAAKAGSIDLPGSNEHSKKILLPKLLGHLRQDYEDFCSHGFLYFKGELEKLSLLAGRQVTLDNGEHGKVLGYSDEGGLCLLAEGGQKKIYFAARVLSYS